ncbi:hypothetical protein AB0J28_02010, partial [Streptosporangium canum]|uniref:hypothetical protein n=1 Tax=Streptosporangium canum TaxID=324952 RepID=UPI003420A0E3
ALFTNARDMWPDWKRSDGRMVCEVIATDVVDAIVNGLTVQGYAIAPAASSHPSETPQDAQTPGGGISGPSDPSDPSTGLSDVQMVIADRYGTRRITLPDATPSERAALLHAVELENLRAELETARAALAEEREITADYRRVNKAALAALDRVRDLHHVHSCERDGHVLDRTPNPCVNDGCCSCGSMRCPTLAAIDSPEEP